MPIPFSAVIATEEPSRYVPSLLQRTVTAFEHAYIRLALEGLDKHNAQSMLIYPDDASSVSAPGRSINNSHIEIDREGVRFHFIDNVVENRFCSVHITHDALDQAVLADADEVVEFGEQSRSIRLPAADIEDPAPAPRASSSPRFG